MFLIVILFLTKWASGGEGEVKIWLVVQQDLQPTTEKRNQILIQHFRFRGYCAHRYQVCYPSSKRFVDRHAQLSVVYVLQENAR